jgi:hypothetical protein
VGNPGLSFGGNGLVVDVYRAARFATESGDGVALNRNFLKILLSALFSHTTQGAKLLKSVMEADLKDVLASPEVDVKAVNVFTIGYEGSTIENFVDRLVQAGVETLVDVRDLPLSRKKGFSKNQFRELIEARGIRYVHLKALGDPKEGRDAARSGNHSLFVKIFSSHMETDSAKAALMELADLVGAKTTCLMCFERCHTTCHRNIVVEKLSGISSINVRHIAVEQRQPVRRKVQNCGHN